MNTDLDYFQKNFSLHLKSIMTPSMCSEIMDRYDNSSELEKKEVEEAIFKQCKELIFNEDIDGLLKEYFGRNYEARWPQFGITESDAGTYNYSTKWHQDGGTLRSLKVFLYLNSVSEHGGNTLMMDDKSSEVLRATGEMPADIYQRKEDLSQLLDELGLTEKCYQYDLEAGDALLFSPLILAHRCVPPKSGKKRYTVCFNIDPI